MSDPGRYFGCDPPPRLSPRLYAEVEDVPGSVSAASVRPSKPTPAQIDRLRRDIAIYKSVEGGMSLRMAGKVFGLTYEGIRKACRRISCRKSRV